MSLGLLPAILSQTRKILTKILRLDTDYTTARATNLDEIEQTAFRDNVENGMIDNNYTATRGTKLDNLDATVSSRLSDVNASSRVQTGLTDQGYTTTRAGYLDNIEQSNLITNVRSGLTDQGYTTGRAPKLDNLNATISSRAQPIGMLGRAPSTLNNVGLTQFFSRTVPGRLQGVSFERTSGANTGTMQIIVDGIDFGTFNMSADGHVEYNDGNSLTEFKEVAGFGRLIELDVNFRSSLVIKASTGNLTIWDFKVQFDSAP